MANSWETEQADLDVAKAGLIIQAEAHGLDIHDEKVIAFLDHQAKVIGAYSSGQRWLQGIIDKDLL